MIMKVSKMYKVKNVLDALVDGEVDLVPQGCNCFCGFGKGLALEIKNRFPDAYQADLFTERADIKKLGTISYAEVLPGKFIVNCYTQYHWIKNLNNEPQIFKRGRKVNLLANYSAIESSMKNIMKQFPKSLRIGIPKIGAGDANGDWSIIEQIIKDTLIKNGYDVTFYVLNKSEIPN